MTGLPDPESAHPTATAAAAADMATALLRRDVTVVLSGGAHSGVGDLAVAIGAAGGTVITTGDDDHGLVSDDPTVVLSAAVLTAGADLGIALGGRGDRCVVVADDGAVISPSVVTILVGTRIALLPETDRLLVCDAMTSRIVDDLLPAADVAVVRATGGYDAVREAMGLIAAEGGLLSDTPSASGSSSTMSSPNGLGGLLTERRAMLGIAPAAASGESHAADVWTSSAAPGAAVAASFLLAAVASQDHGLGVLADVYSPYYDSGVVTVVVDSVEAAIARVDDAYVINEGAGPVSVDRRGGLTVSHWDGLPRWWFTLRPRGDRGIIQVFVEAEDEDMLIKVHDDVLTLLRG